MPLPPVAPALKRFIWDIQSMVELEASERELLWIGRDLMTRLLASDDWLPAAFAAADLAFARQFQVYRDGLDRFTVVSSVLSPGASLHVRQQSVWEIMGVVRGMVIRRPEDARAQPRGDARSLPPGGVDVRPSGQGDAMRLANALADAVSISVHVYGGELAGLARHPLAADGRPEEVSLDYANREDAMAYDIFSIQAEPRG
jgi:predicted metal-dependent enzyme (double-stranded beta helix superfamily)